MNQIRSRLRSRAGASMIIALVFLLFCTFVGGSVLTAASANSRRVMQVDDRQAFLNQRSAAFLVADSLKNPDGSVPTLRVYDVTEEFREVLIGNGGVVTDKPGGQSGTRRTVRFQLPPGTRLSPFQRIMTEVTVWRYLKQTGADSSMAALENFVCSKADGTTETLSAVTDFWYQYDLAAAEPLQTNADVSVTPQGGSELAVFQARCTSADGEDLYDFLVDFGAGSQLKVRLNAVSSSGNPMVTTRVGLYDHAGSEITARVTSTATRPIISWQTPSIEKGGAAE